MILRTPRPKKCTCTEDRRRWRVVQLREVRSRRSVRPSRRSLVACLACCAGWRTSAAYVAELPRATVAEWSRWSCGLLAPAAVTAGSGGELGSVDQVNAELASVGRGVGQALPDGLAGASPLQDPATPRAAVSADRQAEPDLRGSVGYSDLKSLAVKD